jgi:hypothetical protein
MITEREIIVRLVGQKIARKRRRPHRKPISASPH